MVVRLKSHNLRSWCKVHKLDLSSYKKMKILSVDASTLTFNIAVKVSFVDDVAKGDVEVNVATNIDSDVSLR